MAKLVLSLPASLLKEVDRKVKEDFYTCRSEFARRAMANELQRGVTNE